MAIVDIGTYRVHQHAWLRDESGRFLAAVHDGAREAAWELADTLAALVIASIGSQLRIRTGELLGSVRAYMLTATEGAAVAGADHAAPLEEGAVEHIIPNAFGSGRPVLHPGNDAYRFFAKAGEAVTAMSGEIVSRHMPS